MAQFKCKIKKYLFSHFKFKLEIGKYGKSFSVFIRYLDISYCLVYIYKVLVRIKPKSVEHLYYKFIIMITAPCKGTCP